MAQESMTTEEGILLLLVLLLIILLAFIVLFLFFRDQLAKCCPCLVVKIKPESKTGWHYVDRFGETKLKVVSDSIPEIRARKAGHVDDSVEEGSVHTNISLQVPVFEEKLNEKVTKKSVHIADESTVKTESPKKKKKKKKPATHYENTESV